MTIAGVSSAELDMETDAENFYSLDGGYTYMVTPKVALPGELDTLVQTEANAFRFTEAMNVSLLVIPVDRKRPKVLWFSLGGEDGDYPATDAGKETYVFSSMLELYFDQPVDISARGGQKMVTFVPERFESMKPFFPRYSIGTDFAARLRPARILRYPNFLDDLFRQYRSRLYRLKLP